MTSKAPVYAARTRPRRRRVLHALAWSVGTIAILAGFLAAFLPGYLKGYATGQIRAQLHREARIESISVNPFLLGVSVRGLQIDQADGKSALLVIDELHTRVGLSSLFRRAPVIEELRIERPRINLARLAPERYNISDIIEAILATPSNPEGPRFELNSLSVNDAAITFDDQPTGRLHKVEHARLVLPALSSFADDRAEFAEPVVSAVVNGQPFELKGRTRPFDASLETTVDLHLTNLDIPTYLAYSPVQLPLRLDRGRLTTALDLAFVRAPGRGWAAAVKGMVTLDDLLLHDPGAPAVAPPIAAIPSLIVRIGELRWPENSVRLEQVTITSPQVLLRREKSGLLNWQEVFTRTVLSSAAPPATPASAVAQAPGMPGASVKTDAPDRPKAVQFAIASTEVTDGTVQFDDLAAPDGAFHAAFKSITIRARDLSNAEGAKAVIESTLITDAGEMYANAATLMLKPFGVTGEQTVKQIRLGRYKPYFGGVLAGDIEGIAEVHARYAVDADFNLKVTDGSLAVAGFALRDRTRVEVARIAALSVTGGELDLAQRSIVIGGVVLRQCSAAIARDAEGSWNFATLFKPPNPALSPTTAGATSVAQAPVATVRAGPNAPAAAPPGWRVAMNRASLERCKFQLSDSGAARSTLARIVIDPVDLRIDGWSSRPDARAKIDLRARVNGAGQVALQGTAGIAPVAADVEVDVDGLDLVPLQAYMADRLNIRLLSGAFATRGKLSLRLTDTLTARYRGDAGLGKVASSTKSDGEDFVNFAALQARGLDVGLNSPAANGGAPAPLAVTLEDLALTDFYSRLIVNADGTLNVQQIVSDPTVPAKPAPSPTPAVPQSAGGATAKATGTAPIPGAAPPPITIARISLTNGRVNFSDHFIKPNYSANLADVNGTVSGLSSDFASRASVDIRGRYDPSAPVEIKGTINPLRGNLYLDLTASCRDVELTPLTPYSQKYAGYGITKGKMSLQVKYLIEDHKLNAENTLLLDQLTFGDKVDSPDATKLPVLFAVSLLKNAKGEIDINLPVTGSLDDPQFSVFGIVVKIIVNLLVKAATSPFALLGALAGGGEDLAYVDFPPGVADSFASGQQEKLTTIAKALADRPALKLDIAGRIEPVADGEVLRRRALVRKVAALRQAEQVAQGQTSTSAETMTIPPADYQRLLRRAFDNEKVVRPKSAAGNTTEPSVPEMESLLLATITVSPEALQELGASRARAAKEALTKAGVAPERMFVVAATAEADGAGAKRGPRVDFTLK